MTRWAAAPSGPQCSAMYVRGVEQQEDEDYSSIDSPTALVLEWAVEWVSSAESVADTAAVVAPPPREQPVEERAPSLQARP